MTEQSNDRKVAAMKNDTIRSISTAAVTRALVLTGAPTTLAADDEAACEQEGGLSAPVEVGGLSIGTESTSSSSEQSNTRDSDENGTRTRESEPADGDSSFDGFFDLAFPFTGEGGTFDFSRQQSSESAL